MKRRISSTLPAAMSAILLLSQPFGAKAQVVTNLHLFAAGATNGDRPFAGLIQGSDGNFYGTTRFGGAQSVGTVFRMSADGDYTNLYSFGTSSAFDGWQPAGGLVQGSDGNLYGTTSMRGTNSCSCGVVFRIGPDGSGYATIHHFAGGANDGSFPGGTLLQGYDGNFYGTTVNGGAHGAGVVFRISPSGSYTNLYSFGSVPADGSQPNGLLQGSDGNFYGTTLVGGSNGFGTVFRINPDGGNYSVLHRFAGGYYYGNDDGRLPYGTLVEGGDGNFYGTASEGGTNTCSCGVVFRINSGGSYKTLYSFHDYPDGSNPEAGLVLGSDGNFYGTTYSGGTNNVYAYGTLFRISPGGSHTTLYSFGPQNRGSYPQSSLVQGSDGSFYGTTYESGTGQRGTVFKLLANLPSPANQMNGLSVAGSNVVITVASVAGETYQLQYTTDLASGNWSNVPGASVTSSIGGPLTVTNFGGALSPVRYYRYAITP